MFELEYKTKASSGWNNARKAHLFICMDHPLPTAKLMAALHWMDSRYAHIVIDIADTLKRYYHLHLGEDRAYAVSASLGQQWVEAHQKHFSTLQSKCELIRWDHWLNLPEYKARHQQVQSLYHSNDIFRQLVHRDICAYRTRRRDRGFEVCLNYMLEELTKGLIIGLGEPTVLLYNGTFNASTRYLKQHFPLHSTPVRLNFNRRKIPLPLAA